MLSDKHSLSKTNAIQSDFDKLALLDADGWNHNNQYHPYLLKQIPPTCKQALEIGCGMGSFSRLLSQKADRVLALDLSPEMIKSAKQRSTEYSNIEYQVADVMAWDFPKEGFECIVSIATLHHLPFESFLQRMKSGLKTNGILMVLDLYQPEGIRDLMLNLLAVPTHLILKLKNTGRLREPREVQEAWAEHGKRDTYLPVSRARGICNDLLPGAVIKKHLLWRYSIVWQKPRE
jgi:2-polyprenyl-3-methyl-5-hydroxy-6-metoxy-1,4-benzoquinol methylase